MNCLSTVNVRSHASAHYCATVMRRVAVPRCPRTRRNYRSAAGEDVDTDRSRAPWPHPSVGERTDGAPVTVVDCSVSAVSRKAARCPLRTGLGPVVTGYSPSDTKGFPGHSSLLVPGRAARSTYQRHWARGRTWVAGKVGSSRSRTL
jgi:hypothetical protein